jgi:hypothetical protein
MDQETHNVIKDISSKEEDKYEAQSYNLSMLSNGEDLNVSSSYHDIWRDSENFKIMKLQHSQEETNLKLKKEKKSNEDSSKKLE